MITRRTVEARGQLLLTFQNKVAALNTGTTHLTRRRRGKHYLQ